LRISISIDFLQPKKLNLNPYNSPVILKAVELSGDFCHCCVYLCLFFLSEDRIEELERIKEKRTYMVWALLFWRLRRFNFNGPDFLAH
jgi:ribosome-binding factor A